MEKENTVHMYKVPNYSEVKLLSVLFHWKMKKKMDTRVDCLW